MKRRKSTPLLFATAGAATIVFSCRPAKTVPDRIGPTPPLPTPVPEESQLPQRIGPPTTPEGPASPLPTVSIRIGPARQRMGTLELSCSRTVRIWIGGQAVGTTPLKMQLPPGTHTVRVEDGSLVIREFRVDIRDGETVSKTIDVSAEKPVRTPIRIGVYRGE